MKRWIRRVSGGRIQRPKDRLFQKFDADFSPKDADQFIGHEQDEEQDGDSPKGMDRQVSNGIRDGRERFSLSSHHLRQDFVDLSESGLIDQKIDRVRMTLSLLADGFDLEDRLFCKVLMKPIRQAFVPGEHHQGERAFEMEASGEGAEDARETCFDGLRIGSGDGREGQGPEDSPGSFQGLSFGWPRS